jgi:LCP family protein required for cell wall assembly
MKRKIIWVTGVLLLVTGLWIASFAPLGTESSPQTVSRKDGTTQERDSPDPRETKEHPPEKDAESDWPRRPFTVLLLGVDDREGKFVGRSDVIMLAVVQPKTEKIALLSLPRDTYASILPRGTTEKINHAYAYGLDTALTTIEQYLDIPIDYYMAINFEGFVELINLLGGLTLDVERDVTYGDNYDGDKSLYVHQGRQKLSGEEVLLYVRFRSDAEGDFGRNRRQQQVIRALLEQAVDVRHVSKLADVMDIVVDHVQTNLTVPDMIRLGRGISHLTADHVESIEVKASTGYLKGVSYVFIAEDERKRLQDELKRRLQA